MDGYLIASFVLGLSHPDSKDLFNSFCTEFLKSSEPDVPNEVEYLSIRNTEENGFHWPY